MPEQSLWAHINVALPNLVYGNTEISGQGKGSTTWAACSATPTSVGFWPEFEGLIAAESKKPSSQRAIDSNFSEELAKLTRKQAFSKDVTEEPDVTDRLNLVLDEFTDETNGGFSGGVEFVKSTKYVKAKPDIIARVKDSSVWGSGSVSDYKSPKNKAAQRRGVAAVAPKLYLFPFETKPFWKFRFLMGSSHQILIDEWEVPEGFEPESMRDEEALPEDWSERKKKVFHVIRQLFGQMESANRRYGVLHIYECWYFCKRTERNDLMVSRAFQKEDTSPSVFQAIRTLICFDDHELSSTQLHPKSARKAPPKKKAKSDDRSDSRGPSTTGSGSGESGGMRDEGSGGGNADVVGGNIAAALHLSDCNLYDATETVQLFTTTRDPSVLVKLQRDPQLTHVGSEMENEAAMYKALAKRGLGNAIPRFFGFSKHLGVAMSCLSKEMDNFDDIGVENLSRSLKESALQCVTALSSAGVLHNDVALRNFVQSRGNRERAKIIDFGRATCIDDQTALAAQVGRTKILLHMMD